ncbi:ribosome-binding ATPase YchF [Alphaproteobacteria bacterium]|nr:ribosome-binding ATPase YchF [Alphaproteobacteria bacterium]
MGFNCGIVGLPNVGKSTLFNALTSTASAQAANYPFCTIEPNIGRVAVPDPRLAALEKIQPTERVVPTQLEFVDIAGLVRGASRGEGLGNQFLANIRETDAIIHVVRCFDDDDITHVEGSVDPARDAEVIDTELMLADLQSLEKRAAAMEKKAKSGEKDAKDFMAVASPALAALGAGRAAITAAPDPADEGKCKIFKELNLITAKPLLYVANVEEAAASTGNAHSRALAALAASQGRACVVVAAGVEAEAATLGPDAAEYLAALGLAEPSLDRVIRAGFELLGLQTYFTVGPKEIKAWTVRKGALAPEAAGVIHTDFQKGFIRAEVVSYADFLASGGESPARAAGKLRTEGKTYAVADGDIMHFLFNK